MLPRAERLLHQRAMRPALGEDGDGVDVGGQEIFEARLDARQVEAVRSLGGTVSKLVHHIHVTDAGVEIEQVRKLAAELSDSYYAD